MITKIYIFYMKHCFGCLAVCCCIGSFRYRKRYEIAWEKSFSLALHVVLLRSNEIMVWKMQYNNNVDDSEEKNAESQFESRVLPFLTALQQPKHIILRARVVCEVIRIQSVYVYLVSVCDCHRTATIQIADFFPGFANLLVVLFGPGHQTHHFS